MYLIMQLIRFKFVINWHWQPKKFIKPDIIEHTEIIITIKFSLINLARFFGKKRRSLVRQNFHLLYFALGFSCMEPEVLFISLKTFFYLIGAWKICRTICWKIWWIKGNANEPLASAQEVSPVCFMWEACVKISIVSWNSL